MKMKEIVLGSHIGKHVMLYIMILPGLLYFLIFYIVPIIGNFIAFMDYNYIMGITKSKWVGFEHIIRMFNYAEFFRILRNTGVIGFYNIILGFPAPLILALVLNEIRLKWFHRLSQTLIFIPFFLSWVIVSRIFTSILDPDSGVINYIIEAFGGKSIFFMTESSIFPLIVAITGLWRDSGFGCIIYLAALTTIDPQLYEAATIDGAGRFKQTLNITIPMLIPTMLVVLLLTIGNFLNTGFNQIYTLYNGVVRDTGEILINYTYRVGIEQGKFSFATAVGLFQAVVGFTLVFGGNMLSKKLVGRGLFYVQHKEKK